MANGVFRTALQIFRERGGAQGTLVDARTGQCCVLGAVAIANGADEARLRDWDRESDDYVNEQYETEPAKELDSIANDLWPIESEFLIGEAYIRRAYIVNDDYGPAAAEFLLEQAALLEEAEASHE